MQKRDCNSKAVTYKKRVRKRRKNLKRGLWWCALTTVITAMLIVGGVFIIGLFNPSVYDNGFVPSPFGSNISKKVKKAKELQLPDWIDVQLIHKHTTARTGFYLNDIKNIVIHYVGNPDTTAQNNRNYFDKVDTTVSSHFVVGLEGEVIQCVPLYERSAASNYRNKDTISIEVCHPDETGKFNNETYKTLVNLTAYLCNNFSLDENDVIRHYDITEKICPKYYVENQDDWELFKKDVEEKINEYKEQNRSFF